jgi:hypothetical protein
MFSSHSVERAGERDIQVKEGELARLVAVFVDEAAGQVTTEDSADIVLRNLIAELVKRNRMKTGETLGKYNVPAPR